MLLAAFLTPFGSDFNGDFFSPLGTNFKDFFSPLGVEQNIPFVVKLNPEISN